jgi:putative polyhydroxyalkanoate system protein
LRRIVVADIELDRTHNLGLKGAKAAADKMASKLAEKFQLESSWRGETLNFTRSGVNGTLAVSETTMSLRVTLGFMLKMMKGPIEQAIHEQLDDVLAAPAKKAAKVSAPTAAKKPVAKKK